MKEQLLKITKDFAKSAEFSTFAAQPVKAR
jgi:hypothetical protein